MHEHIARPNYPNILWAFTYRGMKVEITTTRHQEETIYSAWVTHTTGSAVAVPRANTREAAIALAKDWIQTHFTWS